MVFEDILSKDFYTHDYFIEVVVVVENFQEDVDNVFYIVETDEVA